MTTNYFMRRLTVLIGAVLFVVTGYLNPCSAQKRREQPRIFPSSTDTAVARRYFRSDTVVITSDSVVAYNRIAQQAMIKQDRDADSIIALFHQRVSLGDSVRFMKDSVIDRLHQIDSIQNLAYGKLHSKFDSLDLYIHQSMGLTNEALDYSKRLRAASYVSAGLAGGIIGGLAIRGSDHSEGFTFNWAGAAIGTVSGLVVNFGIHQLPWLR